MSEKSASKAAMTTMLIGRSGPRRFGCLKRLARRLPASYFMSFDPDQRNSHAQSPHEARVRQGNETSGSAGSVTCATASG